MSKPADGLVGVVNQLENDINNLDITRKNIAAQFNQFLNSIAQSIDVNKRLVSDISTMTTVSQNATKALADVEAARQQLESGQATATQAMQALQQEVENLREQNQQITTTKGQLEQQNQQLQQQNGQLNTLHQNLLAEVQTTTSTLQTLQQALEVLRGKISTLYQSTTNDSYMENYIQYPLLIKLRNIGINALQFQAPATPMTQQDISAVLVQLTNQFVNYLTGFSNTIQNIQTALQNQEQKLQAIGDWPKPAGRKAKL